MDTLLKSLDGKFGEKWYFGNYTRGNAPYDSIITSAARRLIAPIFIGKYRMDQQEKLMKEHSTAISTRTNIDITQAIANGSKPFFITLVTEIIFFKFVLPSLLREILDQDSGAADEEEHAEDDEHHEDDEHYEDDHYEEDEEHHEEAGTLAEEDHFVEVSEEATEQLTEDLSNDAEVNNAGTDMSFMGTFVEDVMDKWRKSPPKPAPKMDEADGGTGPACCPMCTATCGCNCAGNLQEEVDETEIISKDLDTLALDLDIENGLVMLANERQLLVEAFVPQIGMLVVDVLLNKEIEKNYKEKTSKRKRKPELQLDYFLIGGTMIMDFIIQKYAIGIDQENGKVNEYFKLLNQLKKISEDKIKRQQQTRHQDQMQAARFMNNIGVGVLENLQPRLGPIINHEIAKALHEKEVGQG